MKQAIFYILGLVLVATLLLLWQCGDAAEWLQGNYTKVCRGAVLIALLLVCLHGKRRLDRMGH